MMSVFEHICALVTVLCCDRCVYEAACSFRSFSPTVQHTFLGKAWEWAAAWVAYGR